MYSRATARLRPSPHGSAPVARPARKPDEDSAQVFGAHASSCDCVSCRTMREPLPVVRQPKVRHVVHPPPTIRRRSDMAFPYDARASRALGVGAMCARSNQLHAMCDGSGFCTVGWAEETECVDALTGDSTVTIRAPAERYHAHDDWVRRNVAPHRTYGVMARRSLGVHPTRQMFAIADSQPNAGPEAEQDEHAIGASDDIARATAASTPVLTTTAYSLPKRHVRPYRTFISTS